MHLAIMRVAVGDVHRHILRPHDIEGDVLKRQIERTALAVIDPADKPGLFSQQLGDLDEFRGQIDAADAAAVAPGEKP